MKTQVVQVTPEMAAEWLGNTPSFQRKLRAGVVDQYARDMLAGHWTVTHQGIAIDRKGRLIDGQHRLAAIIKSGLTVAMNVTTDAPPSSYSHIDGGLARNAIDALRAGGHDSITADQLSIARILESDGNTAAAGRGYSPFELLDLVERHKNAIHFALQSCPHRARGVTTSATLAAVASAYYHEGDRVRLADFVRILVDGVATNAARDACVIYLRDWLRNQRASGGASVRVDVYLRTQRVIKAFMRGQLLNKLYRPAESIYPVQRSTAEPHSLRDLIQHGTMHADAITRPRQHAGSAA